MNPGAIAACNLKLSFKHEKMFPELRDVRDRNAKQAGREIWQSDQMPSPQ